MPTAGTPLRRLGLITPAWLQRQPSRMRHGHGWYQLDDDDVAVPEEMDGDQDTEDRRQAVFLGIDALRLI
jgi:hypothetical protein